MQKTLEKESISHSSKQNPFSKHASDLREGASALGDDVQELGRMTQELAEDAVDLLKKNVSGYYEQGVKKVQKVEKGLEAQIKQNPLRSLLLATGVGLALGLLWKRGRSQ